VVLLFFSIAFVITVSLQTVQASARITTDTGAHAASARTTTVGYRSACDETR